MIPIFRMIDLVQLFIELIFLCFEMFRSRLRTSDGYVVRRNVLLRPDRHNTFLLFLFVPDRLTLDGL